MLFKIDSGKKKRTTERQDEEEEKFNPYGIKGKKNEDQGLRSGNISKASEDYMQFNSDPMEVLN